MRRTRTVMRTLACATAVAGLALLGTVTTSNAETPAAPVIEDLGPASLTTPIGAAEPVGDKIWLGTTGLSPNIVSVYDPATEKATEAARLPKGIGITAMTRLGDSMYVSMSTPGVLYRVNLETGAYEEVLDVAPDSFIWCLAASPDGKLFMGTYPTARVLSFDPATGAITNLGRVHPEEQYVRSIAADATTIYAGIGARAHLIAIDRATGARREILPAEVSDATFVGTMALAGDTLLGNLSDRGDLLVLDTKNPSRYKVIDFPTDVYVVAIEPHGDEVYLGLRPSGAIYRYKLWEDTAQKIGVPVPEAYTDRLIVRGDNVIGVTDGLVYELDPVTGDVSGTDLVDAGMTPAAEQPMAIGADRSYAYVSGKGGVQVHTLAKPGESSRTFVPGEAKQITPVRGHTFLSVYTLAQVHRMDAGDARSEHLARIAADQDQTRPMDTVYSRAANSLLMSTQPDYGKHNGALTIYRMTTGSLETYRNILPGQTVHGIATQGRYAYLGGNIMHGLGAVPPSTTTEAKVARFDLHTRQVTWMITLPRIKQVQDLLALDDVLIGLTETGLVIGLDPDDGTLLWSVPSGAGIGRLVLTSRGEVYGADRTTVYRVDPTTRSVTRILTGLNGAWFGGVGPFAASTDGRSLFTLRDRNLIRIQLP